MNVLNEVNKLFECNDLCGATGCINSLEVILFLH